MSLEKLGLTKKTAIQWLAVLAATLIALVIPSGGLYTATMKVFLVITVFSIMIIAFELLPTAVMVILMPMLWMVFKVAPLNVIMSPWVTENVWVCVGAFVFAAILSDSGVLTRIAYWLMAKVNGNYTMLLISIFLVGVLLTTMTFGGAYMVMAPLCAGLCMSLGVMKTKMGAAIAMSCMLGTCTAKAFTYPVVSYGVIAGAAGSIASETFANMNFLTVIFHNSPMFIITLLMVILFAKWYKPDKPLDGSEYFKAQLESLGKITAREIKVGVLMTVIIAYMLASSYFGWNSSWAFMTVPFLAFFPGINCADKDTFRFMNWDMIFFIGGCMSIGTVAASLGVSNILAAMLGAISQSGSIIMIFAIIFLIVFGMNFLMTPVAIWSLLSAPLLQLAVDLGVSQLPFMYCLISCAEAIVLPYEYPPYLMVFAFGMMTMGDFVKMNVVRCVIYLVGFLGILVPFWMFLGLL